MYGRGACKTCIFKGFCRTSVVTHNLNLSILSVNLQKSHKDLAILLESMPADILLVQEPSWVQLVPRCSDTDPLGEDTQGSVNHPGWNTLFPLMAGPSPDSRPLVATFLRKSTTHLYVISMIPSFTSLSSLGITLSSSLALVTHDRLESRAPQSVSAVVSTADASPLGEARENRGATMASAPVAAIMVPSGTAYAPHRAPDQAPISPTSSCVPPPPPPFTLQILNFYHHIV